MSKYDLVLAGVDFAWHSESNGTGIAVGSLVDRVLTVTDVAPEVVGPSAVFAYLNGIADLSGIALDAPLIINNNSGQRACETLLGRQYGSRGAACHTSNTTRFPEALSVSLSKQLLAKGYQHISGDQWQIECYPHPAIIEIFGLNYRLKYKKGTVKEKREGQKVLSELLLSLSTSSVLKLILPVALSRYMNSAYIDQLQGRGLKVNEDGLDAIVCLYIAGLHAINAIGQTFGDCNGGYIWVPKEKCI